MNCSHKRMAFFFQLSLMKIFVVVAFSFRHHYVILLMVSEHNKISSGYLLLCKLEKKTNFERFSESLENYCSRQH